MSEESGASGAGPRAAGAGGAGARRRASRRRAASGGLGRSRPRRRRRHLRRPDASLGLRRRARGGDHRRHDRKQQRDDAVIEAGYERRRATHGGCRDVARPPAIVPEKGNSALRYAASKRARNASSSPSSASAMPSACRVARIDDDAVDDRGAIRQGQRRDDGRAHARAHGTWRGRRASGPTFAASAPNAVPRYGTRTSTETAALRRGAGELLRFGSMVGARSSARRTPLLGSPWLTGAEPRASVVVAMVFHGCTRRNGDVIRTRAHARPGSAPTGSGAPRSSGIVVTTRAATRQSASCCTRTAARRPRGPRPAGAIPWKYGPISHGPVRAVRGAHVLRPHLRVDPSRCSSRARWAARASADATTCRRAARGPRTSRATPARAVPQVQEQADRGAPRRARRPSTGATRSSRRSASSPRTRRPDDARASRAPARAEPQGRHPRDRNFRGKRPASACSSLLREVRHRPHAPPPRRASSSPHRPRLARNGRRRVLVEQGRGSVGHADARHRRRLAPGRHGHDRRRRQGGDRRSCSTRARRSASARAR